MEIKSLCDCVNFIESMIICDLGKNVDFSNLENIRDYLIGTYNDKSNEDMVMFTGVLSQINLIIEKIFDVDDNSDLKKEYSILRKHILSWLEEKNTKPEADNHIC